MKKFKTLQLFLSMLLAMLNLSYAANANDALIANRVEYSKGGEYDDGFVIPMDNKGLLYQCSSNKKINNKCYIRTDYYDTNLNLLASDSVLVNWKLEFYDNIYHDGVNYSIMRDYGNDFCILASDMALRKTRVINAKYSHSGSFRNLIIAGDYMVFSSTQGSQDRIVFINLNNGEVKLSDIHFDKVKSKDIHIMDNIVVNDHILAMVRAKDDVYLVHIEMNGDQREPICLTSTIPQHILSASLSMAGNNIFVTGTYADKKTFDKRSQGLYFGQLKGNQFSYIKFHDFLELNHFTDYMTDKDKIEQKKAKAEKKGKSYSLECNIASHDIMENNGYYYYIGEVFYPRFKSASHFTVDASEYGYQYTHAVLVKFDNNGNLVWDNCFEMNLGSPLIYVKRFVNTTFKDNKLNAMFVDGNNIISKLINDQDGEVMQDNESKIIETDNESNAVNKTKSSKASHWFDNNYLVYGVQVVDNKETAKNYKVFFINKYTIK